ncbi:MAG: DUF3006 domain-containing protein [Defluviitaleaceae bacterium]|nr:DUF3006 domain-containing protein [Defluviitaleaceae bacterium]
MSWVIDRIEGEIEGESQPMAVLEHSATGEQKIIPAANLPKGAKEGTALAEMPEISEISEISGKYTIDTSQQEQERRRRIAGKFERLVNRQKNSKKINHNF